MNLTPCSECQHKLSPRADVCPQCGKLMLFEGARLVVRGVMTVLLLLNFLFY